MTTSPQAPRPHKRPRTNARSLSIETLEPRTLCAASAALNRVTTATSAAAALLRVKLIGPPAQAAPTTFTVSPTGPLSTIMSAVNLAKPGDTIVVMPGTYHERVAFPRSGTAAAPITLKAQTVGTAIIDGTGFDRVIAFTSAQYINIQGLTVDGCNNPLASDPSAVSTNSNWTLSDFTVQNTAGTGISVYGDHVTLLRVYAYFNGRAGLSGDHCTNVTIQDCILRGNNTAGNDPDVDGGAGKFLNADHVTVDHLDSFDNVGPGLWFDYNNSNLIIRNSIIHHNRGLTNDYSGSGLRLELNQGPVFVDNNVFYANTGPQIDIQSSRHITVTNNTLTGSYLALKDWPRGADYTLADITIIGNTFQYTYIYTEGGTWTPTSAATKGITIDDNVYQIHAGAPLAYWGNTFYYSLSSVQLQLGLELSGLVTFI